MNKPEVIRFAGHAGAKLAARLDLPPQAPRAYALVAHCFTCSKDIYAASRVSRALTSHGFAVLRFDFTGLGSSEGEFASTNFSSNISDLLAAADYLRANHRAPDVLIGHSLGGAAVLAAAAEISEARAVITIGAPAAPEHVKHLFGDAIESLEDQGEVEVKIGGRPFKVQRQFLQDLADQPQAERIHGLRRALLVMHSPQDKIVGVDNARKIYEQALHPKSFVALDGADHLLSKKADADYAAEVIAAWARRYLPAYEAEVPTDNRVEVAETGQGAFQNQVRAGQHSVLCDEPASIGGLDSGPTPYGLLLGALGACTSMTVRMYARRKKIALDAVRVELRHERVHAKDCESGDGALEVIERVIQLKGDLDDQTRGRLLEIADRCPVHRTLSGKLDIRTRLGD